MKVEVSFSINLDWLISSALADNGVEYMVAKIVIFEQFVDVAGFLLSFLLHMQTFNYPRELFSLLIVN